MGALTLYQMGPKKGQLCGMQATIQLHQMARNSIFEKNRVLVVHSKFGRFEHFKIFRRNEYFEKFRRNE